MLNNCPLRFPWLQMWCAFDTCKDGCVNVKLERNTMLPDIQELADLIWQPMIILVLGGSILLTLRTRFFQIRHLPFILKETFGQLFSNDDNGRGTVTAFQAMTTALASSIGAANIVVAPTVIFLAGPGALFWMWVSGILTSATKFGEVALAIKYREKNEDGEYIGGASYVFRKGIRNNIGKILGFLVSFILMIEILPSISLQTISAAGPVENVAAAIGIDNTLARNITIIAIFILTVLVVYGGVKSIGRLSEKLVPYMAITYLVLGAIILVMHIDQIPNALRMVVVGAFNPKAISGGFVGATLQNVIRNGVARGVYSNEAGLGTTGFGHAAATTDHPARQGVWGVFEVIIDTLVVCTMSGLIILVTGVWTPGMSEQALNETMPVAVERAINESLGIFGSVVISICLFLFVVSTMIVIVFYCEKQAEYLFGRTGGLLLRAIACGMILVSMFISFENAGAYLDLALAFVVLPNMIGIIMLNGEVKAIKEDFFDNPKYMSND